MTYAEILFTGKGPVGILTLNNPRRINALSQRMIAELTDALERAAADEALKVLILRAAGAHFCAGHDLTEMVGRGMRASTEIFERCSRMMQRLHTIPQPVVAQVQGVATAAGCQLAAWCDLVVAEEGARFATPGVKIGLFCTTPMTALTRAVGRKAAMEMLLTGRYYSAAEAQALGLVNRVVPLDRLEAETEGLAAQIAEASRLVLAIGKQGFYAQVDQPDDKALQLATHTIALNLQAADAQTGIRAFIEKKNPVWKNR
ncbi:MAG: enoyl-CoA hydratase [Desulfobacterales bacterium]|jgi:enoyl-CoA hydratase/carnithine racemase|nr:enoyl-CoA hydratase [Desulfobacterales bacterium]